MDQGNLQPDDLKPVGPGHLLREIQEGRADERADTGLPYDAQSALKVAGIDPARHDAIVRAVREALPGNSDLEELLAYFSAMERAIIEERRQNDEDFLTGARSRKWFFARLHGLQREAKAKQEQRPFSLIMLDIDFFKKVNDEHGHLAGDYILQQLVSRIKGNLRGRSGDEIARYGGEEFCIIAMAKNGEAPQLAERIRDLIEKTPFEIRYGGTEATEIKITVSMGVATFYPHVSENDMEVVQRADTSLYAAKNAGRNRVVIAGVARSEDQVKPPLSVDTAREEKS